MKHTLLITVLLQLSSGLSAYAQLFFSPGYLITSTRDTLRGQIREKDNNLLLFRTTSDAGEQPYTPEKVLMYSSEGIIGRSVSWSENETFRSTFVHELIKGQASLFELIKPEERLSYIIQVTGKTYIPLRGSLALLMLNQHLNGCKSPALQQLLTTQSFYNGRSYFERVINAYNRCIDPTQVTTRPKAAFHYEAGLLGGLALNSWNYRANQVLLSPYWNPNGPFSSVLTGAFGGYFMLVPAKRLSVSIEVLYSSYKGSRTIKVNNPLDPSDSTTRQYSFREQYLTLPIMGRYALGNRPVRWYIKGGLSVTYALALGGIYSGGGVQNDEISFRRTPCIGYLAGLGAEVPIGGKRRLLIEVRAVPHYVLDGATRIANSRSLQVMLGVPLVTR